MILNDDILRPLPFIPLGELEAKELLGKGFTLEEVLRLGFLEWLLKQGGFKNDRFPSTPGTFSPR